MSTINTNDSAYRALYSLLVQQLTRTGVNIGGTAGYPRVEINSIVENQRLDKEGDLRSLTFVLDSMTTDSLLNATILNNENLSILSNVIGVTNEGYRVDGIVFTQLRDLSETSDTQNIIYRIAQDVDIYLTKLPPTPDPEPETENETEETNQQSSQNE